MNDIFPVLMDMPIGTKGQVRVSADGDYYVFLNARYNEVQRREIYNHEVRHIIEDDFNNTRTVQESERAASDKTALLDEIKRVEKHGLPLGPVIVRPVLAPYIKTLPPLEQNPSTLLRQCRGLLTNMYY